jgi:hypothetical protein
VKHEVGNEEEKKLIWKESYCFIEFKWKMKNGSANLSIDRRLEN